MRLGLLGGTFDPVHLGHLILAEQCREQCGLDEVWFVPSRLPPHKRETKISDGRARVEMLTFAVAGHPAFKVSRIELDREGPSYTVETLQQLVVEDASRELYFLIGGDSLADLPHWREPRRILELATIVAAGRGRTPLPPMDRIREELGEAAARIECIEMPAVDLSSTDLRRRVRDGRSIRYMTPRAVEIYILEHGLYRETRDER